MTPIDRVLAWLPLVMMAAVMAAAKLLAAAMHRRGLRVVVVDWQRPLRELLCDTLVIVVFLFWFYLLLVEAWPLSVAWLPDWLTTKLFDALPLNYLGRGAYHRGTGAVCHRGPRDGHILANRHRP